MSAGTDWLTLRKALIDARARRSMSQQEIALKMGVTRQTVSHWETGAAVPAADHLFSWAGLLGIRIGAIEVCAPPKGGKP